MTDLLANAERPATDQPRRLPPVVPDLIPPERPWRGPAGAAAAYWRERALTAELEIERLRRAAMAWRRPLAKASATPRTP